MKDQVVQALARLAGNLLRIVLDDPRIREDLRHLADALLGADDPITLQTGTHHDGSPDEGTAEQVFAAAAANEKSETPPRSSSTEAPGPLPKLSLGQGGQADQRSRVEYDPHWMPTQERTLDEKLPARCRLKAEATRFVSSRTKEINSSADPDSRYQEIVEKAGALQPCYLWMLHLPAADEDVANALAQSYEAMSEVADVVRLVDLSQISANVLKELLELVAETQSALRSALKRYGQDRDDDQLSVYSWVRDASKSHKVYLQRFMRADDEADPALWESRIRRALELKNALSKQEEARRSQRKRLDNLRYKLRPSAPGSNIPEEEWPRIAELTHELVQYGLPPSSRELRDLLLPVIDQLPHLEELPEGFEQVLTALDQFRADQQERAAAEEPMQPQPATPQVEEVASLLAGKSLVLIGGDERHHIREALIEAFHLSDLYWIPTRAHQSIDSFEAYVCRADVAAVLLAIRWASHSYGDVHRFCKKYNKPLVRLPRGFNPNQVAAEILKQISRMLQEHGLGEK